MDVSNITAAFSLAAGAYIALLNLWMAAQQRWSGRFMSTIPFVGATFLVLGLLGFEQTRGFAWVGVVVDWGTVGTLPALPRLIRREWATSGFQLVHRFVSDRPLRRDDIRLFRGGEVVVVTSLNPPDGVEGVGPRICSNSGGRWREVESGFLVEGYNADNVLLITREGTGCRTAETGQGGVGPLDSLMVKKLV